MVYAEDEKGAQIGEFTRFENGCVAFVQSFNDIWDKCNFNRIVNHIRGERMEIYSHESGKMTYHGEFNEQREREGWGIEYDAETGSMMLEGIWKGNKLVEIIRKIEGSIMIEFKRNGNNTIASNRIPVFVGEFLYDEEKESFIRNGRGYLIDEETRIATREVEWKDGKEVSGRDLYDGWYTCSTKPISINYPQQLQPQQQSQQPQQPPMGDPFATNPQQRAFYQQLFLQLGKEMIHILPHDAVIAYHSQSGLPKEVLEKIYSMSDLDKDGRLDFAEFVIMTHILFTCRNGVPLPQELPASLIPPSKAHLVKKEEAEEEALPDSSPGIGPRPRLELNIDSNSNSNSSSSPIMRPKPHPGMEPRPRPGQGMMPRPRPSPGMAPHPRPRPSPYPSMDPTGRPRPRPRPGMMPRPRPGMEPRPCPGPADVHDDEEENAGPRPITRPSMGPRPRPGMRPRLHMIRDPFLDSSEGRLKYKNPFIEYGEETHYRNNGVDRQVNYDNMTQSDEEDKEKLEDFSSSSSSSSKADTINNTMPDICSKQMEQLVIASHSMNHLKELDLSMYRQARSIEIGNDCFGSVSTFKIDGLNRLKTIKIGRNSFTQEKNVFGNDASKSFHILNCESLGSIQIGEKSFSDFGGEFELKNLPQLQSIQIGTMGNDSCNFYYSPFVIAGIELILNIVMIRSSKTTIHYIRWLCIL